MGATPSLREQIRAAIGRERMRHHAFAPVDSVLDHLAGEIDSVFATAAARTLDDPLPLLREDMEKAWKALEELYEAKGQGGATEHHNDLGNAIRAIADYIAGEEREWEKVEIERDDLRADVDEAHYALTAAGVALGKLPERIEDVIEERDRLQALTPSPPPRTEPASAPATDDGLRTAAENAMHALLHVDAHMNERVEAAKSVALAIGHPWPPYPDAADEEDEPEGASAEEADTRPIRDRPGSRVCRDCGERFMVGADSCTACGSRSWRLPASASASPAPAPDILHSLPPEELAKVEPLSKDQIRHAIEQGERDADALRSNQPSSPVPPSAPEVSGAIAKTCQLCGADGPIHDIEFAGRVVGRACIDAIACQRRRLDAARGKR